MGYYSWGDLLCTAFKAVVNETSATKKIAHMCSTVKPQDLVHLYRYLVQAWAVASKFSTGGSAVLGSSQTRVLNSDPNVLNPEV